MEVPFLDLKRQYQSLRNEIQPIVEEILEEQVFILGPRVQRFEEMMQAYLEVRHAVGVASGSDALLLSLMAIGVEPGDEVITTPFTFVATAGAIARLGATPVFVDIDLDTFLMDTAQVESAMTPRAKAIIPVHLYGQMVDMNPLLQLAQEEGLFLIEDAAQATGSKDGDLKAGTVGHTGCFSFFPTKNLGGAGDGGMVVTQEDSIGERIRKLRVHGSKNKYIFSEMGMNSRLDALQAGILEIKFKNLDRWTQQRAGKASQYFELFKKSGLEAKVHLPKIREGSTHVFNQFVVRTTQRDELKKYLSDHGVGTEIYYPYPLHLQPCFKPLGYSKGSFPQSEEAARTSLALPMFPELSDDEQAYVVEKISDFITAK